MGKKLSSLNVSVEAIVVLILAITILGLGIAFIRNMFGSTTENLAQIGNEIKTQMIEDLRNSDQRLKFNEEDIMISRSTKKKEIYFGVKNELDTAQQFTVEMGCYDFMDSGSSSNGDATDVKFSVFEKTPTIQPNGVEVMKAIISVTPDAAVTSYQCTITLDSDSDTYETKNFIVTIE